MPGKNEVRIVLKADDRTRRGFKSAAAGLKQVGAAAGVAAAAAVAAAGAALAAMVRAASKSQQIYAQYEVTLRNAVGLQDAGVKRAKAMVAALVEQTGYGDELLAQTADIYARQGLSVKRQEELVKLTADVAAATGKDLLSAASAVNYVLTGQAGMLKRLGIIIDENILKTKNTELILADLQRQMSGSAEVFASTWQGQLNIIQSGFMDIVEEAGNLIIQNEEVKGIFKDIKLILDQLAPIMRRLLGETDLVTIAARGVRDAFRGGFQFLSAMAGAEADVLAGSAKIAAVWATLFEFFSFLPGLNAALGRDFRSLSDDLAVGAKNAESWAAAFGSIAASLDKQKTAATPLGAIQARYNEIAALAKEQGLTVEDVNAKLREQGLTLADLKAGNKQALDVMRQWGGEIERTAAVLGGAEGKAGTVTGGVKAAAAELTAGLKPLQFWVSSSRRLREDWEGVSAEADKTADTMGEAEDAASEAEAERQDGLALQVQSMEGFSQGIANSVLSAQTVDAAFEDIAGTVQQLTKDILVATAKMLIFAGIRKLAMGPMGLFFQTGGVVGRRHLRPLHAQAGLVIPGTGFGDKVPALLSPGELVLPRNVVSQMGRSEGVTNVTNSPRIQVTVAGEGDPLRIQQAVREALRAEQSRRRELSV